MPKRIELIEMGNFSRFRVKFHYDEQMNRAMLTIPGREYIETDGAWLVRPTSARHLLVFAVMFDFDYPDELDELANGIFKDHDNMTVLPAIPNCIDVNRDLLVIRTEKRPPYAEREIIKKIMGGKVSIHVNGMGWSSEDTYWQIPIDMVTEARKGYIRQLVLDHQYLLTPAAQSVLGGLL